MDPASATIFCQTFQFFVIELKLLRKSSRFLLLGVTNIPLILRFMKKKNYYVQTVKVVH